MTRSGPGDEEMARHEPHRNDLDLLLLGPVPPPFGGISVHLSRLIPLLEKAGFSVAVLNHFRSTDAPHVLGALKKNPLNYYRLPRRFRPRILHYHHSRWPHLIAVALGKRGSSARYIVTLHAGDVQKHFPQLISRVPFVASLTRWALQRFDVVVVVDPTVASAIREHLDGRRVELLPAFLEADRPEIEVYDSAIDAFVSAGPLLVVAAYSIQFRPDGAELYGVDTAVEAFVKLAPEEKDLRLAVFLARRPARRRARRHLASVERQLERAGVRERVLIVFGRALIPALRANATFLRPTRADGDAVSIREAISAGVPVVASDVVERPAGVLTFPVGDSDELCAALRGLLRRRTALPRGGTPAPQPSAGTSFLEGLIALYRSELSEGSSDPKTGHTRFGPSRR
jgi:glycosyltransferase involved in cell wall biosynthesis